MDLDHNGKIQAETLSRTMHIRFSPSCEVSKKFYVLEVGEPKICNKRD